MRSERVILAFVLAILLIGVPLTSDTSDAYNSVHPNGVDVTIFDDSLTLGAGGSVTTVLTFMNNSGNSAAVDISCSKDGVIVTSLDSSEFNLSDGGSKQVNLTVSTDKLSKHGGYTLNVTITVMNYNTKTTEEAVIPIAITVTSNYSSDSVYNRIFGIFDSLGEPFNTPEYTAAITMLLWMGVAVLAFFALRAVVFAIFKKDKEAAREISGKTGAMLLISILFYGLSNSLMVYGADEILIAALQNISRFIYIPIIAYIVWNIYTNVIKIIFHRLEEQDKIAGADTSLIPLFNMLGEIIIVVVAASALLGTMGFDLVAIITGAGIAGMAISLGAQSTLSEFFSGINLMATRPFRRGDMVMIGGKDIYQVEKVGLLNSRFKNWCSLEYIVIPNTTVVASTIMNITAQTMAYRMYLYYSVAYDSDVELVKKILVDTAYNHPQVIVDGSYAEPDARLIDFEDSAIKFRLAVYITDFRDYVTVTDELNEDVYRNLCKAGIEIPYNKLEVYISDESDVQQ